MLFSSSLSVKSILLIILFVCVYTSTAHADNVLRRVNSIKSIRKLYSTNKLEGFQTGKSLSAIRKDIIKSPYDFEEQLRVLDIDRKIPLIKEFINKTTERDDGRESYIHWPYWCDYEELLILLMEMKDHPESKEAILLRFSERHHEKISDVTPDKILPKVFKESEPLRGSLAKHASDLLLEAALAVSHASDLDHSKIIYVVRALFAIYEDSPGYYNHPEHWENVFDLLESLRTITSGTSVDSLFTYEWNRRALAVLIVKSALSKSLDPLLNWGRNEPYFLVPVLNMTSPFAIEFMSEVYAALAPYLNDDLRRRFYFPTFMEIAQREHITLREALNRWLLSNRVSKAIKMNFLAEYNSRLSDPISIVEKHSIEIKIDGASTVFE